MGFPEDGYGTVEQVLHIDRWPEYLEDRLNIVRIPNRRTGKKWVVYGVRLEELWEVLSKLRLPGFNAA
jgi:hypothetical protein